jgi:hypothetical protein
MWLPIAYAIYSTLLKSYGMVYYINSLEQYLIRNGCLPECVRLHYGDMPIIGELMTSVVKFQLACMCRMLKEEILDTKCS